jgi:hypothetical protein
MNVAAHCGGQCVLFVNIIELGPFKQSWNYTGLLGFLLIVVWRLLDWNWRSRKSCSLCNTIFKDRIRSFGNSLLHAHVWQVSPQTTLLS